MRRTPAAAIVLLLSAAAASEAQTHDAHAAPAAEPSWRWQWDGTAFAGLNYQLRRFTDFHAVESQNWLMLHGTRPLPGGDAARHALAVHAMASFETLTLQDIGSPQVFQTGETFEGAPLVDYQHPHDLVMRLGVDWQRAAGAATVTLGGDLVGPPTLGPEVFMHRESARDNPQAPLGHHHIDSTHITHGVVRAGLTAGAFTVEASAFQGREPDETRTDLDLGPLDSYAARVWYRRGAWRVQASAGRLDEPEPYELVDVVRLTASVEHAGTWRGTPMAWTAAWGQNRESGARLDAYLLEGTWRPGIRNSLYVRGELVSKLIVGRGALHPPGFRHPHLYSRVGALTGGYVRDLAISKLGRVGVGADVTGYRVPPDLEPGYGSPWSFHAFLRWRAPAASHHGAILP